jgi:hypothetical protein
VDFLQDFFAWSNNTLGCEAAADKRSHFCEVRGGPIRFFKRDLPAPHWDGFRGQLRESCCLRFSCLKRMFFSYIPPNSEFLVFPVYAFYAFLATLAEYNILRGINHESQK